MSEEPQAKPQVRVGDLLMQAGILTSDYIRNALHSFEQRGLPIGKVLVMSGYLTEQQLRTALEVQSLINDGLLPLDVATQVLQIAHRDRISLAEAFQQSGFVQPEDQQTNKLGQLLVGADIISSRELEEALQTNIRTGLPLGHIFSIRGFVSHALISLALLAQQMIRKGMVGREMAIVALKEAYHRELFLEKQPINRGFHRLPQQLSPKLGELMMEARILSEGQLLDALHRSLIVRKFLGEVLVDSRMAQQAVVDAAIDIQEMLDNGVFKQPFATQALLLVASGNESLERAVAEIGAFRARTNKAKLLIEILTSSGNLNLRDIPGSIQERLEVNYNQCLEVCNLLLEEHLVHDALLYCALRAVYLVDEKILNLQQSIMIVDFALRMRITLDEALIRLGWVHRTRLRTFIEQPEPEPA